MDVMVPCLVPTCFHVLERGDPSKWVWGKALSLQDDEREDREGDGVGAGGKGGGRGWLEETLNLAHVWDRLQLQLLPGGGCYTTALLVTCVNGAVTYSCVDQGTMVNSLVAGSVRDRRLLRRLLRAWAYESGRSGAFIRAKL